MKIIKCDTFDDFTKNVRSTRWGLARVFRGQRDISWPLSSKWERMLKCMKDGFHPPGQKPLHGERPEMNLDSLFSKGREGRNKFRDAFLERFRASAIRLPGIRDEDILDDKRAWEMGRHVGLVTPLLDWSYSPFIAAYFACIGYAEHQNPGLTEGLRGLGGSINFMGTADKPAEPISIWELALPEAIIVDEEFEIVSAKYALPLRQKAQQGLYTRLEHHTYIDLESYLRSRDMAHYLTRYDLPGQEVGRALHNLSLMNFSYGSLFPDLEGAALEANTVFALGGLIQQYPLPDEEIDDEA